MMNICGCAHKGEYIMIEIICAVITVLLLFFQCDDPEMNKFGAGLLVVCILFAIGYIAKRNS